MSQSKEKSNVITTVLSEELPVKYSEEISDYVYHDQHWWKYNHFRKLHWYIFVLTLTSTNNGYDGSMLNGLQSLSTWKDAMGNPEGYILGALANGTIFGGVLAVAFASWACDRFGRKLTTCFGSIVTVIGAILQGASTNYAFFFVSRMVIGFGFGLASVASPTLIAELSFPTYRPTCTALYNVFWYLGAVIAAWVTYGTRTIVSAYSWRIPSYLQGLLPLVQVCLVWWVPESPRFLVSKGKIEKAREFLIKFHTGNDTQEQATRLVEFELKEIEAALEMEKINSNSKYTDFITIKTFRKRIFLVAFTACMTQLSGNGLVSYYLSKVLISIGITGEKEQLQINGCLMIYNLVLSLAVAFTCYLFRRKALFIFSCSFMLLSYVIWTILSAINQQRNFEQKGLGQGVLAMIFIYYLAYNIGLNGLPYLYVTEILPYTHRAKGINLYSLVINITLIYNGFVNAIAMDAISWKYYIVYCCIIAVELVVVIFTYVETFGYTLEEVARVFEGTDSLAMDINLNGTVSNEKIDIVHSERGSSA
ncbi:hexose transporter [Scheffersomyces stipitis CBS 6054]|uniref:Hexose transporter n=2 Tax=Scheffersomyces stipitis (strain ATCC 58785 / CBS 6054 / NBRC 10063 / NRRL Y-11545) TaxID=322104 RepID=A3LUN6_PICST|nr:hexose transporter [Scheffersomyces stipitis CBS 6054]ABN66624.2 hexose transporter [Scheffersomyces stipitis CBS 6054]KAG2733143.1 hypothetical protein G9P44_004133 [Scheffersomyces stipitis]